MGKFMKSAVLGLLSLFHTFGVASAANSSSSATQYVTFQTEDGETLYLADNRRPALYTNNFGDCLGKQSTINVSRFDAAYYKDNQTIVFHFDGQSALKNASVMLSIAVYAYGENRFNLIFDPCNTNIGSSVPVYARGIIPVSPMDVANIPDIAYSIPDFEGQAILRVFSNLTRTEIGCYSAIVTNGASFSQPAAVGSVLGIFTLVTLIASIATAIYGEAVPTMRLHYAHSLSTGVVFAVWHHIFFSGALSVNWPSVLPAFWSNYAWAAGMIYTASMQDSINSFIGNNKGNTASVGAAAAGSNSPSVGGGSQATLLSIYRRFVQRQSSGHFLHARADSTASSGYGFYGHLVGAGLPLPGNYSGFAGTLVQEDIPVSNAFTTGLIWFVIFLLVIVGIIVLLKWTLELLARVRLIRSDRFRFFRTHWLTYVSATALRTCFLAFFMIMFLTIFQFTYDSASGVKGLAGVVFAVFLVGVPAAAIYACLYKRRRDRARDAQGHSTGVFRTVIPTTEVAANDQVHEIEEKAVAKPFWKRMASSGSNAPAQDAIVNIHDDEDYIIKFGWLAARFRRTRWWFFTFWLFYELVRAAFYGGASGYPLAQVFGLLVVEILSFAFIVWARPFEGQRLNILVVYCLGFSKVVTVALSAAFDVQFNLGRIITTAIGIVIIVVQGILTIITLIAIIVGAISSYMSVSRNRDDFRPRKWTNLRERYFDHLDRVANDLPRGPKPKKEKKSRKPAPVEPEEPNFALTNMSRMHKIEDDDAEFVSEMQQYASSSHVNILAPVRPDSFQGHRQSGLGTPPLNRSRAGSLHSLGPSSLPYGARQHRPSWSSREFTDQDRQLPAMEAFPSLPVEAAVIDRSTTPKKHHRTLSRGSRRSSNEVRPIVSTENIRYGGESSSQNVIGLIPEPSVRPRAGTLGSRSHRRSTSLGQESFNGQFDPTHMPMDNGSSNNARRVPLTPAQELEEFNLPSRR